MLDWLVSLMWALWGRRTACWPHASMQGMHSETAYLLIFRVQPLRCHVWLSTAEQHAQPGRSLAATTWEDVINGERTSTPAVLERRRDEATSLDLELTTSLLAGVTTCWNPRPFSYGQQERAQCITERLLFPRLMAKDNGQQPHYIW